MAEVKPECRICMWLVQKTSDAQLKYCCGCLRFNQGTVEQWFSVRGIIGPNKTVAAAQQSCTDFRISEAGL
jgi:hypothetical protein